MKRCVKIGLMLCLIIGIFAVSSNVFGAINESYYNQIGGTLEVDNSKVDNATSSSLLLDAIAILVYAVGSLLEMILGAIFEAMSGDNIFPWADAILFNAVPMLDINIFNPSGKSIVASLQGALANTYWTVFTLAAAFFGIAIMITAIKLAISTIASDKAQYKQAIVKWITGFAMLWGIHIFISFAIYLNEELVKTAQQIASNSITEVNIDQLIDTNNDDYDLVYNFVEAMNAGSWNTAVAVGVVLVGIAIITIVSRTAGVAAFKAAVGFVAKLKVAGTIAAISVGGVVLVSGVAYSAGRLVPQISLILNELRYNMDDNIRNVLDEDGASNFLLSSDGYPIAAFLLRDSNYVETLENRFGHTLRGDAENLPFITPGKSLKSLFGKEYASEDPMKWLAFDVMSIIKYNTGDPMVIEIKADDTEEINYIDYLRTYVEVANELDKTERIRGIYNNETDKLEKVGYYVANSTNEQFCNGDDDTEGVYCGDIFEADLMFTQYMVNIRNSYIEIKKEEWEQTHKGATEYPEGFEADLAEEAWEAYYELIDDKGIARFINYDENYIQYANLMVSFAENYDSGTGKIVSAGIQNTNIISALANTFKKMAWKTTETSWRASRVTIEGALLYAILVAQSLIFFISYAKRLFYVILLIMMAPIVVVYDFFTRFSS